MLLTQLIHLLFLPPGLQCLLGLFALHQAWRGRRTRAVALALTAIISLYVLATPVGAWWLVRPLEARVAPVPDLSQLQAGGWQAVVLLGGGRQPAAVEYDGEDVASPAMLVRLRYAARVQRQSGLPLLVSGGMPDGGQRPEAELMTDVLRDDYAVPVRWLEPLARTTRENAEYSAALLLPAGMERIVLVSHASHLPRAVADFERAGFNVLAAPTAFTTLAPNSSWLTRWTPQSDALVTSRAALHEWLGLARDLLR